MDRFSNKAKNLRVLLFIIYDMTSVCLSEALALLTRFDFRFSRIDEIFAAHATEYIFINIITTIAVFACFQLYNSLWRYASVREMINVVMGCAFASLLQMAGMYMLQKGMPRSYWILYMFYLTVFTVLSRFTYRSIRVLRNAFTESRRESIINTMIIGGGDSAFALIKDIYASDRIKNRVLCIIDADKKKIGRSIMGVPIVGDDFKIVWAAAKYEIDEIFIAIPNLPAGRRKDILEICKNTGARLRILPSMEQIVTGDIKVGDRGPFGQGAGKNRPYPDKRLP